MGVVYGDTYKIEKSKQFSWAQSIFELRKIIKRG